MVIHVEGASQSFIVQKLEVEHVTVSRLLDNLEKMGWIERKPDPNDKRSKLIFTTDKVKPLLKEIEKTRNIVENEFFGCLSATELKNIRVLLHKINDNFSALPKLEI